MIDPHYNRHGPLSVEQLQAQVRYLQYRLEELTTIEKDHRRLNGELRQELHTVQVIHRDICPSCQAIQSRYL